ncbi:hypothetical protein A9W99_15555 [Mycobacterium sp. 1164966.3]|uniref:hypothetical protein n=1 Tax=Mycobacterium sp. 1164966.3 TaxID=1856861 RepID=UPI0007FFB0B2|nr:hypothetical protein [Mycobacterium sp. 1164966.3]OBA80991.1 hypothetical protein A9W99_15555 [Mycobacterium sp. 1164966.3]
MTAQAATHSLVDDRISRLRQISGIDPQAARDAAWAWIERLGAGLPGEAAEIELAQLFAAGTPAVVDGQTEGMLVGWTKPDADLDQTGRLLHAAAKAVTDQLGLMPWLGKKFDRPAQRGTNAVTVTATILTKLLAPSYRLRRVGGHWEGFDMLNRVEASVVAPDTRVLVLDYETIGTNPWPINRIRDEAVQIVPGIFLGAKLWHQDNGYRQLAYWAARSPIEVCP